MDQAAGPRGPSTRVETQEASSRRALCLSTHVDRREGTEPSYTSFGEDPTGVATSFDICVPKQDCGFEPKCLCFPDLIAEIL